MTVEDWAEIRRLHRSEGMAIKAIARTLGISRNAVPRALARDLPPRYVRPPTGSRPYTATTIFFVQGPASADVQIDHVVALSAAWRTGAQQWTATTRKAFANDPLNLLAVHGPTNASKGDSDAARVAAAEHGLPVRIRRPSGRREGQVRFLDHQRREERDERRPKHLPRAEAARQRQRPAAGGAAGVTRCPRAHAH